MTGWDVIAWFEGSWGEGTSLVLLGATGVAVGLGHWLSGRLVAGDRRLRVQLAQWGLRADPDVIGPVRRCAARVQGAAGIGSGLAVAAAGAATAAGLPLWLQGQLGIDLRWYPPAALM